MLTSKGHLSYCSNIHAGESWEDHFIALKNNFPDIKKAIAPESRMGIGLRLSNEASLDLIDIKKRLEFEDWLHENNAYVFTMNGFPYGGFHHTRVKDRVHAPDWTTSERLNYTIRLFEILHHLVPYHVDGGISTSPLTYRHWFNDSPQSLMNARVSATKNIVRVAIYLISLKKEKRITLHLDIEPEPDGLLQTGEEFIKWFEDDLLTIGKPIIASHFGVPLSGAESMLKEHIRLCYDICHFAIGYEPHQQVLKELKDKGILIGKIQISAALKVLLNKFSTADELKEAFADFNESTYLHQVVARKSDGKLIRYPDLPQALNDAANSSVEEWRAHFHVPLFLENLDILQTTQSDIVDLLEIHKHLPFTNHLEVETYTWEVLPEALKLPIQDSIIRELNWVKKIID